VAFGGAKLRPGAGFQRRFAGNRLSGSAVHGFEGLRGIRSGLLNSLSFSEVGWCLICGSSRWKHTSPWIGSGR
jgi:hypothetical protein